MSPDRLSRVFAALADPTRREILASLAQGMRSVTELAAPHDMSLPAISKHLRVLENSGLIERARDAQWRPCRLQAAPMKEAVDYMEQYRRFWEASFDRLEAYLQELQAKPTEKTPEKKTHARQKSPSAKSRKSKLTLSRVFDAPRPLVFQAWTQPQHLKQWSAPKGFKIPINEGELRPGGPWKAVMVMPDGTKLALGGFYTKVVENELLVFTHRWEGDPGPETVVTVRFADAPGGKTRLKFEQTGFTSIESRDGHGGGWKECFDRLDTLLVKLGKKAAKK